MTVSYDLLSLRNRRLFLKRLQIQTIEKGRSPSGEEPWYPSDKLIAILNNRAAPAPSAPAAKAAAAAVSRRVTGVPGFSYAAS